MLRKSRTLPGIERGFCFSIFRSGKQRKEAWGIPPDGQASTQSLNIERTKLTDEHNHIYELCSKQWNGSGSGIARQQVALIGATGETGKSILNGLIHDGSFDITIIVRPQSLSKPSTKALADRGFPILPIGASTDVDPSLLRPFTTIISCVDNLGYHDQTRLAVAAKAASVQRFVPCGFTSICPPSGIMELRDRKEAAYNDILKLKLGYTIIDVGTWHQFAYPRIPSERLDYSFLAIGPQKAHVYGDGTAKILLTDLRDIGRFVARVVRDPRTLDKKVFTWSDELSQLECFSIVEKLTGETIERTQVPLSDIVDAVRRAREVDAVEKPQTLDATAQELQWQEYLLSKYVREDNTRENALYLGYLDAKELYPDFVPISFEDTIKEALDGNAVKLYEGRF
ncbi:NAD(P)-binding protein [Setomelanomma holmii]|uniref:NAD(P)-binding protein n=1 Tax=Setomelanomma holmii TaxID=210430 RepID=A0A9P4H2C1_9PLEO|nr:NAD(P)-binding protein [Setomelanomma holmii]